MMWEGHCTFRLFIQKVHYSSLLWGNIRKTQTKGLHTSYLIFNFQESKGNKKKKEVWETGTDWRTVGRFCWRNAMFCPMWNPGTKILVEKLVKSIKICSSVRSITPILMLSDKHSMVMLDSNIRGDGGSIYWYSLHYLQLFCKTISKWEAKNIFFHWTPSAGIILAVYPFLEENAVFQTCCIRLWFLVPSSIFNSCLGHSSALLWTSFLSTPCFSVLICETEDRWLWEWQGLICITYKWQWRVSYHWFSSHSTDHCWMIEEWMMQGFC